ncbi:MAG: hypothetical protein ACJ71Q_19845 [Terriglobales bacterium]
MILPIGSRHRMNQISFLICLPTEIDEATVLHRGKVRRGTYAGELLANLHDAIFHRSLELTDDYMEYYSAEYATFTEYARKRFLLPSHVIEDLGMQFAKKRKIFFFHPSYSFLEDGDYGIKFLEKLLEPGRKKQ